MENLTREIIEELNDVEPYCFKTDREEEIQNAIKTLQVYNCGYNGVFECGKHIDNDIQDAFYAGAKWADEHPKSQWISVDDDLPCNHVELLEDCFQTKYVEACFTHSDGSSFVTIVKMVKVDVGIGKDCWTWSSNLREHVTYWKPISEPPKNKSITQKIESHIRLPYQNYHKNRR